MKPNFMDRAEKLMAEIRTISFIDKFDTKFIEDILKDELYVYYAELHRYYDDAYDEGYAAGKSSLEGDVDSYALGYTHGFSEGYSEGHSEVKTLIKMST